MAATAVTAEVTAEVTGLPALSVVTCDSCSNSDSPALRPSHPYPQPLNFSLPVELTGSHSLGSCLISAFTLLVLTAFSLAALTSHALGFCQLFP